MIRWDGDNTRAINLHFSSITKLHHTISFISDFLWKTFCSPSSWPLSGPLLMPHFVPRTTWSSTPLTMAKKT
jgi:hypothetical protein